MTAATPDWVALQQRMDGIVDGEWGEAVEIHPWATGDGYSSNGGPDPARPVLVTTAGYETAGSKVVGETSAMQAISASSQVEQDVWMSVQKDNLGTYQWKADDRVYWPYRNEWYTINYAAPSATRRPNIHLVRLNENALHAMMQEHFKDIKARLRGKKLQFAGGRSPFDRTLAR